MRTINYENLRNIYWQDQENGHDITFEDLEKLFGKGVWYITSPNLDDANNDDNQDRQLLEKLEDLNLENIVEIVTIIALKRCLGVQKKAANLLGITQREICYRLKKMGLGRGHKHAKSKV